MAKSHDTIIREWDEIAVERDAQLQANNDLSFSRVLRPWILSRLDSASSILDVGCGTGHLTKAMREHAPTVVGVDPSSKSIELARSHDSASTYADATLEQWVPRNPGFIADLVVANMVLMDTLDLDGVFQAISRVAPNGRLLATITHPAFWPRYWGYDRAPGFDYSQQLVVEAPFRTRAHRYAATTTHIHRPLGAYLATFRKHNIYVTHLDELRGPEHPYEFPFPRFIGFEALVGAAEEATN